MEKTCCEVQTARNGLKVFLVGDYHSGVTEDSTLLNRKFSPRK